MGEGKKTNIVTIDGPSASGKTTLARWLGHYLQWPWVSTGIFYRGIGFVALTRGWDLVINLDEILDFVGRSDEWRVELHPDQTRFFLNGIDQTKNLQHEDVGQVASRLSQIPKLREALLKPQRCCYRPDRGLVAEGRDCGTVVFPEASIKIFLKADLDVRAQRRAEQKLGEVQELFSRLQQRDEWDSQRKVAPLKKAEGAFELDTTGLSLEESCQALKEIVDGNLISEKKS